MKIRYIYEFWSSAWLKPRSVWQIDQPLALEIGHIVHMAELAEHPMTIQKVEHYLEEQAGVAVCKTCIHCH